MAIFQNLSRDVKVKLLGLALLMVAIGQGRIFLLENINYQMHHLYFGTENSSMHSILFPLGNFSYDELILVKWFLTIAFTVIFFTCSYLTLSLIFQKSEFNRIFSYGYALLVLVTFVLYITDGLIGELGAGYKASRMVMGIAQSPMPLLLLLPFFTLAKQK